LLVLIYAVALSSVFRAGLASNVRLFLLAMPFAAAIFLGKRAGFIALGISYATMLVFAVLYSTGVMVVSDEVQIVSHDIDAWFSYSINMVFASMFVLVSVNYLLPRLADALTTSRELTQELEIRRQDAEQDAVNARLQTDRMRWVADFGNLLISLRRRNLLVWRVVRELVERFELYQVNLFLVDRSSDALELVAAAGEVGEDGVRDGWTLPTGGRSLLGRVAQSGREQTVVVQPNEISRLPLSRVEMALPLVVRGELLGVLDIHSAAGTFSENELQLLHVVAGYISAALDILQLFEESEAQMQEMRALYTQSAVTSWRSLLEIETKHAHSIGNVDEQMVAELAAEALRTRTLHSAFLDDERGYLLVVPLVARSVCMGYIAFTRASQTGDWDQETSSLIESAAERLALALDNTRLLVETRRQAFYQEQIGRIGEAILGNPSTEMIMERSVRELGRFLGAGEVKLFLTPQHSADSPLAASPLAGEEE
jgi:GAF domain-containing protein